MMGRRGTKAAMAVAMAMAAIGAPAAWGTEPGEAIRKASRASEGILAAVMLRLRPAAGSDQGQGLQALGICLDAKEGIFVAMGLPPQLSADLMESIVLEVPGIEARTIPATFLGIDPGTGLGFVKAKGDHPFRALPFAASSGLSEGDTVVSVGLSGADPARPREFGLAYVSTQLRLPDRLVGVTGGRLGGIGSPVLNEEGKIVGLVGRQLYQTVQLNDQSGQHRRAALRGLDQTQYFMPVEEFVQAFSRIPTDGKARRVGWIGCGFRSIPDEINMLGQPAVKLQNVIADQPAAQAGLREEDILLAIDAVPLERLATPAMTRANVSNELRKRAVGETVRLTIRREGKNLTVPVTIRPLPTTADEARRFVSGRLGLVLREKVLLDEHLGEAALAEYDGLLVDRIVRDGPAHRAQVQPGDLVTSIQSTAVKTADQVQQALAGIGPDQPVQLTVRRGMQEIAVIVEPANPAGGQ